MKSTLFFLFIGVLVLAGIFYVVIGKTTDEDSKFFGITGVFDELGDNVLRELYTHEGALADVSGGDGSGVAMAAYQDGTYRLLATFENIPDPVGSDFYEGWVVRRGDNQDILSTGRVEKVDGAYANIFTSDVNLLDHDFYVLTIEPDDGNPAPADHVLEGTIIAK